MTAQLDNVCLATDSYKLTHWKQYPPFTRRVYSYLESRKSRWPATMMFGLQYILMRYFTGQVVTAEKIDEAEELTNLHFGQSGLFNRDGWEYILKEHGGMLPLEIKAVPEGRMVPIRNVLSTVVNTDERSFWLTNFVETKLMHVWFPITVGTRSYFLKRKILDSLNESGTPEDVGFKLHDFGYRGVSSEESAALGGAAHLVNFMGTDTFAAIMLLRRYYDAAMAGFSIPASEHSTITSWGPDREAAAFGNMLKQYPTGLVACVSDSFNIFEACSELWGEKLRDRVLEREGTLVIRPDSGDPIPTILTILETLGEKFGVGVNDKGYKVLNPHVRVIQGDGIDEDSLPKIIDALLYNRWSADNIAFGSGGGLLQKMDRDTNSMAYKCSAVQIGSEWQEVYKNPVTDTGKKSKRGMLSLVEDDTGFFATRSSLTAPPDGDVMETVFRNGEMVNTYTLDDIRKNAWE